MGLRRTVRHEYSRSMRKFATIFAFALATLVTAGGASAAGVSTDYRIHSGPNPVGLLQGAIFERLLEKARERFDYILIDGPALRSIVDGVIIANKADGTVMVVSAQRSDTRAVQGALGKLRSFASPNLLGVVLNGVSPDASLPNDYYVRARQLIALPETSSVG
jgi:Mrp family chromosome partitioning ATPase